MENPQKVDIRCILKGETAKKFQLIQHAKGLDNKTEVVRQLIIDYYNTHFSNGTEKLQDVEAQQKC